jgi:hypothetical protein
MRLTELRVGGPIEPWRTLGVVDTAPRVEVEGCSLTIDPTAPAGLLGWGLDSDGVDVPASIDGIPSWRAAPPRGSEPASLGIVGWDHVVVMTSSLDRTCGAIETTTGAPLKRIRDAGGGVRQGFHRLGGLIVEVVESPQVTAPTASLWGFVWNVAQLDTLAERLGPDVMSAPRDAVQRGRRIASVRHSVGLGVAVALMSP